MKLTKKQRLIHKYLLDLIGSGMKEGDLLPTVTEISAKLAISPMTVTGAMDKAVELGMVVKRQGKGTFVGPKFKNSKSAKLASAISKKTIAFVSPFLFDDIFMNELSLGFTEAIDHDRFSLISKHVMMPFMKEDEVTEETAFQSDGMVLMSHMLPKTMKVLKRLEKAKFPIVYMDHYPKDGECTAVCVDNADGTTRLMEHLYELGHRSIIHFTLDNNYSSTITREKTYEEFMVERGLTPLVLINDNNCLELKNLMLSQDRPTAIFAQNDGLATQVYHLLKSIGLSVPGDVSLVGFDDDDGMADFEVPLTTYAQPKRKIGAKCAELIQQIISEGKGRGTRYMIPGELVVRDSTTRNRAQKT